MREVQEGVWHWQAPHPDWKPDEEWGEDVSSYALEVGEMLVLVDPLAVPDEIRERAAGRDVAIVLTCPWHARDARRLVEELDAELYVPPPEEGDPAPLRGNVYRAGDRLPVGLEALPGLHASDLVLWAEDHRALLAGDSLIDRGAGLEVPTDWTDAGASVEDILEEMRQLLELPVHVVLPTHGEPAVRDALERALA